MTEEENEEMGREIAATIAAHPAEFALGYAEAGSGTGMTYDDDQSSARSVAYDAGRALGQAWHIHEGETL